MSLAWIGAAIIINVLSLYGVDFLSVAIPFGWTKDDYPLNCKELESIRDLQGQKYIVEPGFPYKFSKETDDALDISKVYEYCGGSTIISSNRLAFILNVLLIFMPLTISVILLIDSTVRIRHTSKTQVLRK